MFKQIDYTMIIVSDMERSVEFYRDKLGIPLKFQTPDWTEFATGATTLALHGGGTAREYQDKRSSVPIRASESRDTHNLMVTETHPTLPRTVLTSATTRLFTQSLDWLVFRSIPRSGRSTKAQGHLLLKQQRIRWRCKIP